MNLDKFVENKKKIKLGFLGGSITLGAGASNPENCYRRLITKALNEHYEDVEFEDINAAIGGTGSGFGLFRMNDDLLKHSPDMIIVEFAVNDFRDENCGIFMENIVRKAFTYRKDIPIMFVYTVQNIMTDDYKNGELPISVIRHNTVADYYNIPAVNVGKILFDTYTGENKTINDYTIDGVHPNDNGYKIYADAIMNKIFSFDFCHNTDSKPLYKDLMNAAIVPVQMQEGWEQSGCRMYTRPMEYVYSYTPGTAMEFEFEGEAFGIYFTMEKDSGNIEFTIDNGEVQLCHTWDVHCRNQRRDSYKIVLDNISKGTHKVKLWVADAKEDGSEGRYVRIGGFFVA